MYSARTMATQTEPARAVARPAGLGGIVLFWFGLLVFAALQGALVLVPATTDIRFPVDTYGYIAKAEQLRSCPRQDCPALVDLREQVEPVADPAVNWERNRAYHRGLYIYHPLHSAALLGLRTVLPSWEAAWLALTVAGYALVVGAIAWFAYAVWAPFAGGMALLILAPTLFAGYHGLHTIVPGTLALAIGFLSWALIIGRTSAGRLLMPVLVAAMLTMHAVGLVFAGMTLLLYLAVMDRRSATTWLMLGAAGAVVLIHLALPHLVDRPALAHWQHPPPAGWAFCRHSARALPRSGRSCGTGRSRSAAPSVPSFWWRSVWQSPRTGAAGGGS